MMLGNVAIATRLHLNSVSRHFGARQKVEINEEKRIHQFSP